LTNGGNGWGIWADANLTHYGQSMAISSYDWCTMSQEVDLVAAGYSTAYLDAAPIVNMSTRVSGRFDNSPYSVKMELRDASHGVIATYTTSGNTPTDLWGGWLHISTSTYGYGSGLRYIYFEQKGKDRVFWAGQYGAVFDDAYVELNSSYSNTITYATSTGGTISGSSTQVLVFGGDSSTVTATPATGYYFVDWNDAVTSTSRRDKNVVTSTTYTANFAANSYTINYLAGTGGVISGSSTQVFQAGGTSTEVVAIPDTGFVFSSWSDASTSASRIDYGIAANATYTASFTTSTYILTYSSDSNGSISGSSSQTVEYGQSGSAVEAIPSGGYSFVSWSDGSTSNPRTDTNITASASYSATFRANYVPAPPQAQIAQPVKRAQKIILTPTPVESQKVQAVNDVSEEQLQTMIARFKEIQAQIRNEKSATVSSFARDLFTNIQGEDVRELQKYLNSKGYRLIDDGLGSPGNETDVFGALTRSALARFQEANGIFPAQGYFGPKTRQFINGQ
jgi:hypothetical protein